MAKAKPKKIPAVGYLRKSQKSRRRKDGKRSYQTETSLEDQKERIKRLRPKDGGEYEILRWYTDPGIQGWQRGWKRPDYQRMVNDIGENRDAVAVLVDDADRFSRADVIDTMTDTGVLRDLGVRYIHAVNQGSYDVHNKDDQQRLASAANSSHDSSLRLSRRITETRWKLARRGIRSGGNAPYGFQNTGDESEGTLAFGEPQKVRRVQWIFDEFVNKNRSIGSIVTELNAKEVPPPQKRKTALWTATYIRKLLRNRVYCGYFVFNERPSGQFHGVVDDDYDGSVATKQKGQFTNGEKPAKLTPKKVYPVMIEPELFREAQKKLDKIAASRSARYHSDYALSGILFCGHCGSPMYPITAHGPGSTAYRCSHGQTGKSCKPEGNKQIMEKKVIPWIVVKMQEKYKEILIKTSKPPKLQKRRRSDERRKQLQEMRDNLQAKIDADWEYFRNKASALIRQKMEPDITKDEEELKELDKNLAGESHDDEAEFSPEQVAVLKNWWKDFGKAAISVDVTDEIHRETIDMQVLGELIDDEDFAKRGAEAGEWKLKIYPKKLNEALKRIGAHAKVGFTPKGKAGRMAGKPFGFEVGRNGKENYSNPEGRISLSCPSPAR